MIWIVINKGLTSMYYPLLCHWLAITNGYYYDVLRDDDVCVVLPSKSISMGLTRTVRIWLPSGIWRDYFWKMWARQFLLTLVLERFTFWIIHDSCSLFDSWTHYGQTDAEKRHKNDVTDLDIKKTMASKHEPYCGSVVSQPWLVVCLLVLSYLQIMKMRMSTYVVQVSSFKRKRGRRASTDEK